MELQSKAAKNMPQADIVVNAGRLLLTASKIMHNDGEEDETVGALDSLECSNCRQCVHCRESIKALTKTIRLTMMEINEIKERHRERRHREFVELFEKYLGSDIVKSHEILKNIKTEDLSNTDINNEQKVIAGESSSKKIEASKSHGISMAIRKRQSTSISESTPTDTPQKKLIKSQNSRNAQTSINNVKTKIGKIPNQRDELDAMRQKMLDMQRRKMEDRERKKRTNTKI